MEEWKQFKIATVGRAKKNGVNNFFTIWEISNLGNVRKTSTKTGITSEVKPSLTGGHPDSRYLALGFNDHFKYVHRIVALHFVPNHDPVTLIEIDHIDGDKQNNVWTNLRWVTSKYNQSVKKIQCPHCGLNAVGARFSNHIYWCHDNPHRGLSTKTKIE